MLSGFNPIAAKISLVIFLTVPYNFYDVTSPDNSVLDQLIIP